MDNITILHFMSIPILVILFYKTSITDPGYHADITQEVQMDQRFCRHCKRNKPPRCHHCIKCKKCVLRLDHHSSWFNNCLGKNNYKFFFFTIIVSTFVTLTYTISLIQRLLNDNFGQYEFYFVVISLMIGILLGLILLLYLGFHTFLIINNKTTLELIERKKGNYDKGKWENIKEMLE